jgi:SAM-dependent methyltransferase/flagellin-like hook-associated protein FlgL
MASPAPIRPSIALAAFAEKFIDGRRVLIFGNALSPFWEQLIERGARLVHVCDCDAARVAEAAARNTSQHVSFAPLSGMGLAVRDGAFDVGFVDNLAEFSDPAQTLHKLKRALSPRGVALVCAPNPDVDEPLIGGVPQPERTVDYYSLYDLVHREFPIVRMAGQMPFVGYSVAELAPADEPSPCFDAGFVPGGTEEPEWFIAIASQTELEFEPFLVVQLPHESLSKNASERLLREQLRAARSAERGAVERLARLEAEQRKIAEVVERHHKDVDLARQLRLLQEELERKESWILQLEARAATADARADASELELAAFYDKLGVSQDTTQITPVSELPNLSDLRSDTKALRERLEASELALSRSREQHLDLQSVQQRLEAELGVARAALATLESERSGYQSKLSSLESERDTLQSKLSTLDATRIDLESEIAVLVAGRREVTAERDALLAKQRELTAKLEQTDPEVEKDLVRLEAQLVERSQVIVKLQDQLAKTEQIGASLLRELERTRKNSTLPLSQQATFVESSPTVELSPQSPETVAVVTASTETWTHGPTVAADATTEQSGAQVSTWSEAKPASSAELENLQGKLDRLAALAAQQQADLGASQWRLEQISAENQALQQQLAEASHRANELQAVRARLQETEVLLAQLRWREATTPDNGPMR